MTRKQPAFVNDGNNIAGSPRQQEIAELRRKMNWWKSNEMLNALFESTLLEPIKIYSWFRDCEMLPDGKLVCPSKLVRNHIKINYRYEMMQAFGFEPEIIVGVPLKQPKEEIKIHDIPGNFYT